MPKKKTDFTLRQFNLVPGDPVTATRENGETFETTARSRPFKTGGYVVIRVEGITGAIELYRVQPRQPDTTEDGAVRATKQGE